MARPETSGVPYFPVVTEWDQKLKLVRAKYKLRGVGCIVELWRAIYREGYSLPWDDDAQLLFSGENDIALDELREIVTFAAARGIFDKNLLKEHAVLTSHGIQKQWLAIVKAAHRKTTDIDPKICLLSEKELQGDKVERKPSDGGINSRGNDAAAPFPQEKTPQSKAKQSKAKQSKEEQQASTRPPAAFEYSDLAEELKKSGIVFSEIDLIRIAGRLEKLGLGLDFVAYALDRARAGKPKSLGGLVKKALLEYDWHLEFHAKAEAESGPPPLPEAPPCKDCGGEILQYPDMPREQRRCTRCGITYTYDDAFGVWLPDAKKDFADSA